jgi:hypothetical protein
MASEKSRRLAKKPSNHGRGYPAELAGTMARSARRDNADHNHAKTIIFH